MDVEAEICDLKRRVGELEGSFGFLTNQVRDVHRDLLGFQKQAGDRFDRVETRLDGVDTRLDQVGRRFDLLDAKVDELPRALAEVVRSELDKRPS